MVLQKFADGTDTTIAQVVDIVRRPNAVHKIQKVIDGRHDIAARNGPIVVFQRWGANHLHARTVFNPAADIKRNVSVFPENCTFTGRIHVVKHRFVNDDIRRNNNFTRLMIDQRLREHMTEQTALPPQLLRQLVTPDCRQIITLRIKEQRFQQLLRIVGSRQLSRTQPAVDFPQRILFRRLFILFLFMIHFALECRLDQRMIIEKFKDFFIRRIAKCTNEHRNGQFTRSIDTNRQYVAGVRLQLNPCAAIRNNRRRIQFFPGRIHCFIIISSRRTNELAYNDTFSTVDNKGAGIRHQRKIAHENFLFFDFARFFVSKANNNTKRRGVSHVALLAFIQLILRSPKGKILKGKYKIFREILYRGDIAENLAHSLLHEPFVGISLNIKKMGHLHYFFDLGIAISGSFAHLHRIKHEILHSFAIFRCPAEKRSAQKSGNGNLKHEKTRPFCQSKPCRNPSHILFLPVIVHIPLTHAIVIRMAGNNILRFLQAFILSYTTFHVNNTNSIYLYKLRKIIASKNSGTRS